MHFLDLANGAGLHQQRRHAVEARGVNLDAHLRHDALEPRILRQLPRFVEVVRQRLLAIDVLAQLQRAHGDRRVHVVGGRDVHRIELLAFLIEQLAPVLVDSGAGEVLPQLRGAVQIHLRHRHQVHLLGTASAAVMSSQAMPAAPKLAWRSTAAGRPGDQVARDERRRQSSGAEGLEK